ncbi:MAG TPA: AAA family ATPase [Acidimicrobiales bacterium]|nr:AAA family ATPase [Acidimicrobiales bacterium]
MFDDALTAPIDEFVADLTDAARSVSDKVREQDVANEAYNLVAAFIDADGRHTDDELWAFIAAFAPRFDTTLQHAKPDDVRSAHLVDGKAAWLDTPSTLFQILAGRDAAGGTQLAKRYYDRALAIAHVVCSLDDLPSESELAALGRYRSMLLTHLPQAALPSAPTASAPAPPGEAAPEPPKLEPARPLPELMKELDELVGLEAVKREVKLVADLIQVQNLRKQRGLKVAENSRHLVFTGNPGTGKTTVARLLAQIYRTLGVVQRGHLIETDRAGLVAGFVGQTALQVKKVFESALGGVLLIDEAYALARGGDRDFGQEAIDTIVKLIEDHRDDIVVIAAGYPDEMDTFINSNPGLRSRFPKTIQFPDYTTDELIEIFKSLCEKSGYVCTDGARTKIRTFFDAQPRDKGFGNGRLARNLFEAAVAGQATRVVAMKNPTDAQLQSLTARDLDKACQP